MEDRFSRLGGDVHHVLMESRRPVTVAEIMGRFHLTYPETLECLWVVSSSVKLEYETQHNQLTSVKIK